MGSGEFSLTFDERLKENEDADMEGRGGGGKLFWTKALRWMCTSCIGGKTERLVQLKQGEQGK